MTKAIHNETDVKETNVMKTGAVKPAVRRVTAAEVLDWILKEIQIPIFSSVGVNQIEEIKKKRKEWQV